MKPDHDSNPYAPPATFDAIEPRPESWYTKGIELWVKNGATLPAIDLETGDEGSHLIRVNRKITGSPWWAHLWWLQLSIPLIDKDWKKMLMASPIIFGLPILFFIVMMVLHFTKRAPRFQMYRSALAERRSKIRNVILGILYSISSALLISGPFLGSVLGRNPKYGDRFLDTFVAGLIGIIVISIGAHMTKPKITLDKAEKGWVKVTGIYPAAFLKLRLLQRKPEEFRPAKPLKIAPFKPRTPRPQ